MTDRGTQAATTGAPAAPDTAPTGDGAPGGPGAPRLLRRGWKGAFFVLAAVAIVLGAAWALLGNRFLVVRSVQVRGTGPEVTTAQVLAAARVPLGEPLIRLNGPAVAHRVERITDVQSAQVSSNWPNTVVITVRLRVPVFAVAAAAGDGFEVVDRFGVDMRDRARRPAGLPLLTVSAPGTLPGALRGNPAINAAATVLGELPHRIARRVQSVTAASASDVSVKLAGGTVIVWGDTSRARQKAAELTVLMRRHARLYDVSAPGTAVTKG